MKTLAYELKRKEMYKSPFPHLIENILNDTRNEKWSTYCEIAKKRLSKDNYKEAKKSFFGNSNRSKMYDEDEKLIKQISKIEL